MSSILRTVIFASAILLSNVAQAQLSRFDGIWQNIRSPGDYYSLHSDGNILFVDLTAVEESGVTPSATYYGGLVVSATGRHVARLTVLSEHPRVPKSLDLIPASDTELTILWCYSGGACAAGLAEQIKKVF